MRVRLHAEATVEFGAAAEWYERSRPGLGQDFLDEISRALAAVESSPESWPRVADLRRLRRFLLARFPFAILYEPKPNEIIILAVAHTRRRPGYWLSRLREN